MQTLKTVAFGFWNLFVLMAMLVGVACTVAWWLIAVAPVRIYHMLKA